MDLLVGQSLFISSTLIITQSSPTPVKPILDSRKDWFSAMCKTPAINRAMPIFSPAERVRSWLILYIYFTSWMDNMMFLVTNLFVSNLLETRLLPWSGYKLYAQDSLLDMLRKLVIGSVSYKFICSTTQVIIHGVAVKPEFLLVDWAHRHTINRINR